MRHVKLRHINNYQGKDQGRLSTYRFFIPRLRQKMRKLKRTTDGQGRPAKASCITEPVRVAEENLRTLLTKHHILTSFIARGFHDEPKHDEPQYDEPKVTFHCAIVFDAALQHRRFRHYPYHYSDQPYERFEKHEPRPVQSNRQQSRVRAGHLGDASVFRAGRRRIQRLRG
jgi:hypothetical protein